MITERELLITKKYRAMSLIELTKVIDNELEYEDWLRQKGKYSEGKAKILFDKWRKFKK